MALLLTAKPGEVIWSSLTFPNPSGGRVRRITMETVDWRSPTQASWVPWQADWIVQHPDGWRFQACHDWISLCPMGEESSVSLPQDTDVAEMAITVPARARGSFFTLVHILVRTDTGFANHHRFALPIAVDIVKDESSASFQFLNRVLEDVLTFACKFRPREPICGPIGHHDDSNMITRQSCSVQSADVAGVSKNGLHACLAMALVPISNFSPALSPVC